MAASPDIRYRLLDNWQKCSICGKMDYVEIMNPHICLKCLKQKTINGLPPKHKIGYITYLKPSYYNVFIDGKEYKHQKLAVKEIKRLRSLKGIVLVACHD